METPPSHQPEQSQKVDEPPDDPAGPEAPGEPADDTSSSKFLAVLIGIGLAISSMIAQQILPLPAALLDTAVLFAPAEASAAAVFALLALNFVAMALVGAAYLAFTGRGWAYVDLEWPTLRGWGYVLGGIVASIGFIVAVQIVVFLLELPSTPNQIIEFIGGDPNMVLLLIVIVFFFNAPAEEFLFRNVIQKRLYDAFSRAGSILIASAIFAVIHLPAYALTAEMVFAPVEAITVSLVVVFGGSIIFGALYARTENLVVPIAAHAAINAFQFALLYIALRWGDEEMEAVPAIVEFVVVAIPI